ncbi:MAG: pyroglutamyl-peptidase I [Sandaracinaceae bacterium]
MTRTVLLTGFEPFGGERINASAEAVRAVDAEALPSDVRLVRAVLPVTFEGAVRALRERLDELAPSVVVCTGQAGGRAAISVERVAINVADASMRDNVGAQPIDVPIEEDGPVAYWSTLPIKATVAAIGESGVPAEVSQTAGTFVCNYVFYGLMHALRDIEEARAGFIHLPHLPTQAAKSKTPCLPVEAQARALEIAIAIALTTRHDVKRGGGATH